jgi:hypothetical protein
MSQIAVLDQWRKKTMSVKITLPVPFKEINYAIGTSEFLRDALRLYDSLLLAHTAGYSMKMLDNSLKEIADFNLYLEKNISGSTSFTTTYKIGLNWRAGQQVLKMQTICGADSISECLSRATFVAWDAHQHIKANGYILIAKPHEKPTIIAADDFYED